MSDMTSRPQGRAKEAAPAKVAEPRDILSETWQPPPGILGWFSAVNHKAIGLRFIVTAFIFFLLAGVQGIIMRTQIAQSNLRLVSPDLYNQLFSMHGSTMLFLVAVPIMTGLGFYLVPLMIGARDMAFPRLNVFGYWTYFLSGATLYFGFFTGAGPDGGWFSYVPLTRQEYSPGLGLDYWATAISLLEISALVAAIELIVTIFKFRAPGMSLNRMPVFVWSIMIMSFMVIVAMPSVLLATVTLALDRLIGTNFYNILLGGDPILYQHYFWFFGHPEVYIIFVPGLGIAAAVIVALSRRPLVAYNLVVLALMLMGIVSFGLWAHHMFTTGLPPIVASFFTAASMMVTIPSGIQMFAFIATIWQGRVRLLTPMLFVIGFILIFVMGGVTGVMLASAPFNWQTHDTYFVVAHMHYVLIGGSIFPLFAAIYFWFPKMTGRMLSEPLGKWNFWLMFIGTHLTFFPQHWLGFMGMTRRIYTYNEEWGWDTLNMLSTVGAYVFAGGVLVFILNFVLSLQWGEEAGDNPWDASTLEWTLPSPPPQYNFRVLPVVYSRDPLWHGEPPADPNRPDTAADRGIRARAQFDDTQRETFGSSLLDAEPQSRINLVGPSLWPVLLAVSTAVIFVGSMFNLWFAPAGFLLGYVALVGWHWPFNKELAS